MSIQEAQIVATQGEKKDNSWRQIALEYAGTLQISEAKQVL